MIARCDFWVAAGFRVLTRNHVERLRGGAPPRSYRGTRPRCASGTLMSLRTAPTPLRAKHQPPRNILNRGSPPPPHTQNTNHQVAGLKPTALPRHSSLGTGRTRNPAHLPQPRRDRSVPRILMHAEVHISSAATSGCPSSARTGPLQEQRG